MKTVFIVGNWKSNKTLEEAKIWLEDFDKNVLSLPIVENQKIIICAPFTLLGYLKEEISTRKLPFALGAENVSAYPPGAYTGEVNARQVREFADWVIIGHSERRIKLGETDELLEKKAKAAKEENLKVIFCVQNAETPIPQSVDIIAYEPTWAIGSGKAENAEQASQVIGKIKQNFSNLPVIYGGSVDPDNILGFMKTGNIDGVIVGGVSLEPVGFTALIKRIIENKD